MNLRVRHVDARGGREQGGQFFQPIERHFVMPGIAQGQNVRKVHVGIRILLLDPLRYRQRLVRLADDHQIARVPLEGADADPVPIVDDGAGELTTRKREVPVQAERRDGLRGVSVGEIGVERQRGLGSLPAAGEADRRGKESPLDLGEQQLRQQRVGRRELRAQIDGLLEALRRQDQILVRLAVS